MKDQGHLTGICLDATSDASLFDNPNIEFLSTLEAAAYLRTTVGSIRNATSSGKIPAHCYCKFGTRVLFIKSELRKLLLDWNKTNRGVSNGN
jgi:excisionase family DNA binding protein